MRGGYKVVLTADRSLAVECRGIAFIAFASCINTRILPRWFIDHVLFKDVKVTKRGEVEKANYELAKIEAALLDYGAGGKLHSGRKGEVGGKRKDAGGENKGLKFNPSPGFGSSNFKFILIRVISRSASHVPGGRHGTLRGGTLEMGRLPETDGT